MTEYILFLAMTLIMGNEGFSHTPYLDTENNWTIGYGHNLGANHGEPREGCAQYKCLWWSREWAYYQLSDDVAWVHSRLDANYDCYRSLPMKGKVVMLDLGYNVGVTGALRFEKFLVSLCEGDFGAAAGHLEDSEYAEQVPNRAKRNIQILQNGYDL